MQEFPEFPRSFPGPPERSASRGWSCLPQASQSSGSGGVRYAICGCGNGGNDGFWDLMSWLFSFLWCFSLIFFEFFTRTFSGLVDILILDISLFEGQRLLKKIVVPMTGYYRRHLQNLPESHRVRFSLEGWTKADTSSAIKSWRNWMTKWKNQVTCCCLWWVDLIAMLAMLRC